MKKLVYYLLICTLAIISFNCQKELSNTNGGGLPGTISTPAPITASLQGNVLDENGQPASGVAVKVGSQAVITNAKGYFRIKNASLDKIASLVVAEKAGYFKGYRVFSATSGTNNVLIKLIKRDLAGTITNNSGGEVSVASGSKIKLQNGGVMKADGSSYNGDVKVYAAYIDPSVNDIAVTVPGSFLATDKDGKRVTLASYGMLAVELESPSGEKLQVKTGSTATLTTAIPSSGVSNAPATISLWYVDEQTGVWKEEGTATKNGNVYVGDVKHFSFWNCDVSATAVLLSMKIVNAEGTPMIGTPVRITRVNTGFAAWGYTDSLGQVSGLVPGNESLKLDVLTNYPCYTSIYSQNISPLTTNTNLGVITVANNPSYTATIKGHVTNCSNATVTNGKVLMNYGYYNYYLPVDNSGNFSTTITICPGTANATQVIAIDNAAQQQSNPVPVTVVPGVIDLGTIQACGTSASEYFNYTLDGVDYVISSASGADSINAYTYDSVTTVGSYMGGTSGANMNHQITFYFTSNGSAGTFPLLSLGVNGFPQNTLVTPFNVTVTTFPAAVGQFYVGSFSGQFKESANPANVHTISCTFRVRR